MSGSLDRRRYRRLHAYYLRRGFTYLRTVVLDHRQSGALFQRQASITRSSTRRTAKCLHNSIRGESGDGENLPYSVEYSEEFLGNHEHGGDGAPVSYAETPFSTMDAAQADGGVPRLLPRSGDGHAPLYGEILTVAVIEPDL